MGGDSFARYLFEAVYVLTWLLIPHILWRKKNPVSALAWIWAILLFPILGAVFYLGLGTNRVHRKYLRRKAKARVAGERPVGDENGTGGAPSIGGAAQRRLRMLEAMTGKKTTHGNGVRLLTDPAAFYASLLRDIETAREHVHLEFYIWNDDATGRDFLDALIRAAKRGIEVRLLVDEIGSIEVKTSFFKPLVHEGGKFSWFLSLHFLRNRFFINLRNHRKLAVIDGRTGYVGGTNIGDEYLGRNPRYGEWRDTHFRVEGPCVPQLQEVFADDWYFATDEKLLKPAYYPEPSASGSQTIQVIADGPDNELDPLHMTCLDLIAQAEGRVWIETPYFIPYPDLIAHLQMAALKGIDVRLILSGTLDHAYLLNISCSYYEDLLKNGVRIFEYQKGILHSKLMVVDGTWSFAGSANMDIRSFRLNFELNLAIHDAGLARQIEEQMEADLLYAREIRLKEFEARPWIRRAKESVLRLLAPAV